MLYVIDTFLSEWDTTIAHYYTHKTDSEQSALRRGFLAKIRRELFRECGDWQARSGSDYRGSGGF